MMNIKTIVYFVQTLALTTLVTSTQAQEVSIPDPGLNAAIHEALQKPSGPLTQQDLLTLTNLDASGRNISSVAGLEAVRNLVSLNLEINQLANFSFPTTLSNLTVLVLRSNSLTSCSFPAGLTRLNSLDLAHNLFASFSLPSNLSTLSFLDLGFNGLTNVSLPSGLTNLTRLVIRGNRTLTDLNLPPGLIALRTLEIDNNLLLHVTLPAGMKSLLSLHLEDNELSSLSLPAGMTNLTDLFLRRNHLDSLALPADLAKLAFLDLEGNQLTNVTMPGSLTALTELHFALNHLASFTLPGGLTNLASLDLFENALTSFTMPGGLTALTYLDLGVNQLTRFTVPADATNLTTLLLSFNQLTNVSLAPGLRKLELLGLSFNQLGSLDLPSGLTALAFLNLNNNQLTNLTLPPDVQQLIGIFVDGNPLTTFVLSEPLAATNLAVTVATLRNQVVSVFTYPLTIQLVRPQRLTGTFQFGIDGPPGTYTVVASTDLVAWNEVGTASNALGSVSFVDVMAHLFQRRFYRALMQSPPANMVFISPCTFTMGSPTNEQDRSIYEGPQTTVILTYGFWIGKYEVTQGEYLSVMDTNPSVFPSDLSRPVSDVRWLDATNYCAKLTQRELAAGRIPAGSQYRLPTEAEWECAARAGTSTRFSYGDDPSYSSLTNYAWFLDFAILDLTVHAVGQKLPNPWGLYDMYGNVWEWCQDWYDSLPGGTQLDPTGPPASVQFDLKVMRGGAYDYPDSSCRSASRLFFPATPFHTDSDLGFRVVLFPGPQ